MKVSIVFQSSTCGIQFEILPNYTYTNEKSMHCKYKQLMYHWLTFSYIFNGCKTLLLFVNSFKFCCGYVTGFAIIVTTPACHVHNAQPLLRSTNISTWVCELHLYNFSQHTTLHMHNLHGQLCRSKQMHIFQVIIYK